MDKHLLECLDIIKPTIRTAMMDGRVSGAPFVEYTNQAASIFIGFETIAELLQIDLTREGCDDEDDRLMSARQKDALLALVRETSWLMVRRVSDIADWADNRLKATEVAK